MSSRAWIAILGLGIGGLVILGILTKVAVESSPELQALIRVKAALAEELSADGVEEVSLRRSRERRGLALSLVFAREQAGAVPEELDQRLAEQIVKELQEDAGGVLELDYTSASGLGCEGPSPVRKALVPLAPVRVRLADREAHRRLSERFLAGRKVRFASYSRSDRGLEVSLEAPGDPGGDLKELAFELEPELRSAFGSNPYPLLWVRVGTAPAAPPATQAEACEVLFDRFGQELDERGRPTGRRAGRASGAPSAPAAPGREPGQALPR